MEKLAILAVKDIHLGNSPKGSQPSVKRVDLILSREGTIGESFAMTVSEDELPSALRSVKGEATPEAFHPDAENLRAALEPFLAVAEVKYDAKTKAPPTREEIHQRFQQVQAAEDAVAQRTRELSKISEIENRLRIEAEKKAKELSECTALCEVKKLEASLLEESLARTASELEKQRQALEAMTVAVTTEKDVLAGPPTEYEVGDRVYMAGDARRKNIGVVSFKERTTSGLLYHVSWTGGPAAKGTHRYKELLPEGYKPPPAVGLEAAPPEPQGSATDASAAAETLDEEVVLADTPTPVPEG